LLEIFEIHVQRLLCIHKEISEVFGSFGHCSTLLEKACHGPGESYFGQITLGTHDVLSGLLPLFAGCSSEKNPCVGELGIDIELLQLDRS
jgi:hypothetical protein